VEMVLKEKPIILMAPIRKQWSILKI
jgi:hypothetical protein